MPRAYPSQDIEAAHVRHPDVEKNRVKRAGGNELERPRSAIRLDNIEIAPLKKTGENDAIVGDVVDHEKARLQAGRNVAVDRIVR
jgi:hypothetical protein